MSLEIPCAAEMVFAAWSLKDEPVSIGLCGAQEVIFLATLESSSECSRWRRIVVLDIQLSTRRFKGSVGYSRFSNHVSLEKHFIKLTFGTDKISFRVGKM